MTTGTESERERHKRHHQRQRRPSDPDAFAAAGLFETPARLTDTRQAVLPASAMVALESTRATFLSWPRDTQRDFIEDLRRLLESQPVVHLTRHTSVTMARVRARPAGRRPASHRQSRTPRGHWFLVSLILFFFAVGLLVEGYTRGVLGENSTDQPHAGPVAAAPAAVTRGGPVINASASRLRSYVMPARTIALTFDDGPDPTWTPKVLAVLRKYRVPATFFLVGAHAASYPALVDEELRYGDEVGSHTSGSAATPRWPTGADFSAAGSAWSTSSASTWTGGCSTCSAPSRRCPARSARSGGRH